jgi:hypothetical protein
MLMIFFVAFLIACFAAIWVEELTSIDGLLWFIPKIYPYPETFMGKVLRCSVCFSGWICLAVLPIFAYIGGGWIYILPATFFSMASARVISK